MSAAYVVAVSCSDVKEVTEPKKFILYSFEITWSDDSTTSKELSSDDLTQFRNRIKTEVYKSKPDVVIPEVPDGKAGAFASKAKKAEKRKKNVEEFCTQIINLPHIQGKLQAIAGQFHESSKDVATIKPEEKLKTVKTISIKDAEIVLGSTEKPIDRKSTTPSVQNSNTTPETGSEDQSEAEDPTETETPESDYAEVMSDRCIRFKPPTTSNSKLQYVEIEIIAREKRETREVTPAVYAEVVMLKASSNSDWLKSTLDPDDPEEDDRSPPIVPRRTSLALVDDVKNPCPSPTVTVVTEKAEVRAPEQALEMTDSAESTLVQQAPPEKGSDRPTTTTTTIAQPGIFDAAMMSNFPSRTLIPIPPNQKPKKCPASSDVTLSKNELPSPEIPNICVVAIGGCKTTGDNTLPFKRKQRGHLLYATDVWWFISTGEAIGWVPADFWRIVTPNYRTVSCKALPPFAPWNYGVLGRDECETLLKTGNQLDFIVRESAKSTGHLVLSVKRDESVHHFGIQVTETGLCYIGQHHFQTIHNVVLYYMKHALFADANGTDCRLGRLFVKPKK